MIKRVRRRLRFDWCAQCQVMLIIAVLLLAGCGYHLRQAIDLPPEMRKVYIQGMEMTNPFAQYLGEQLSFSDGQLVVEKEQAGMILVVHDHRYSRRSVSLSSQGKSNEYELSYQIQFTLKSADGETLMPKQSIEIIKDYFNPQVFVIGKASEEAEIRVEIYKEAVRTLLRRAQIELRNRIPQQPKTTTTQ